ncbi:MAG: GNAT family protein [Legionellaceae bacterium]|nr:GNAT family protein [Legionellaceae bacterium]
MNNPPTQKNKPLVNEPNCSIREPSVEDENSFLTAMLNSQILHKPWVASPQTPQDFKNYIQRVQTSNQKSFLALNQTGNIAGVFNINEIVRGFFQNAYLGFFAVADFAGHGYMSAGLKLVLQNVFTDMALHRLEANIQPENSASIRLVKNNGFKKEGYSPRYLNVNGEWRDHERWAITYEDWKNS